MSIEPNTDSKRIYIVDDDPQVRAILKTLLERFEPKWAIKEFGNARDALAAADQEAPHLVICDQIMPHVTGTEMFDDLRRKHPESIRILLSGHASDADKIASAQQCLAKPFKVEELVEVINRSLAAQESLADPAFAKLIGSLTSFPALSKNCTRLLLELEGDEFNENMNRLISEDGGIFTRALQLANSPLFHGSAMAQDPRAALMRLGTRNMRALVMSVHVFHGYDKINLPQITFFRLWKHCRQTAEVAEKLAVSLLGRKDAEDVFFAALVHDLGRLIFMDNRLAEYKVVCQQALAKKTTLEFMETQKFGKNNTELTRFMLQLWGMPDSVCRAVVNHVEPWQHPEENHLTLTTLLYVANHLTRQAHPPDPFITPPLNMEYLRSVGFEEVPRLESLLDEPNPEADS